MHKLGTGCIGLQLHIAPKAADDLGANHAGSIIDIAAPCQNVGCCREYGGGGRLGFASAVMPLGDVTNFMSNDTRQFSLSFQVGQQTTVDVDVTAGQGEGVDIG